MTHKIKFAIFGAGFIGKALIRYLLARGHMINVLDHKACPSEFINQATWQVGEFDDKSLQKNVLEGADVAYHLISSTVPGDDASDSIKELSDNIFSVLSFLDTCRRCHIKRVVFISSSSVYGLQAKMPISECATTNPISSHGIQKLTIEKYLLLHEFLYDMEVRIVRLSNPYGPGQNLFGRQGFIALAIGKMLKNEPILLRDYGRPVRDFIYIEDVSKALAGVGIAERAPSILNIGSGVGCSLIQIIELMEAIVGRKVSTVLGEARKVDIPVSVLDISLASESIGFSPMHSMHEGIHKTLQYHGMLEINSQGASQQ